MHVYPNPATTMITVALNETTGNNSRIRFIDQVGRVVSTYNVNEGTNTIESIDISNLKSGFYTLQYMNNGRMISQSKIVKY